MEAVASVGKRDGLWSSRWADVSSASTDSGCTVTAGVMSMASRQGILRCQIYRCGS